MIRHTASSITDTELDALYALVGHLVVALSNAYDLPAADVLAEAEQAATETLRSAA